MNLTVDKPSSKKEEIDTSEVENLYDEDSLELSDNVFVISEEGVEATDDEIYEADEEIKESVESDSDYRGVLNQYFKDLSKYTLLTPEEEKDLLSKSINGDKSATDELILRNMAYVIFLAKKYRRYNCSLEFEDLIQEGTIGLMKAISKFSYSKGRRLSTYAYGWIRQAISRAIASSGLITIPTHATDKINSLNSWVAMYYKGHNRAPSDLEIEEKCKGLSLSQKVRGWYRDCYDPVSLNKQVYYEDNVTELGDLLPDGYILEDDVLTSLFPEELGKTLHLLSSRERAILRLRFYDELTLQAIGEIFGVSRERIRQIERKALDKLRNAHSSRNLRGLV